MPNDNIDRAIKRAFDKDASQITEATYEGYGPFGTAFLIETATDNTNRTVSNIKHLFSKAGGALGSIGSVAWQFETRGQILISSENIQDKKLKFEELELVAIEAGAIDVRESEEGLEIYTKPEDLLQVKDALVKAGATIAQTEIIKESNQGVDLTEEQKSKVEALFAALNEDEDITAVHTSANL
jgi:YebC/PmpR family DNA-binding regulatory protein